MSTHSFPASHSVPSPQRTVVPMLNALFVLSGFSALIYQSIWSQYLGLVLGHAAYAQTLVLMMFMGGMALGSWLVSRFSLRFSRLIGIYAVVEALIAIAGAGFHPLFLAYSEFSQSLVLPALKDTGWATAWQWGSAATLIAPQTVLLGATFPLIASGILRFGVARDGEVLGMLYFTNSIGAAVGVLVATFVLLPLWGMAGALWAAAAINAVLAMSTAWLSASSGEARWHSSSISSDTSSLHGSTSVAGAGTSRTELRRLAVLLLSATFFSSAASFAYEIGWVRLLNQALGTTLHGFELMLAAFIAGLALGGLWVRRRAAAVQDVARYAGYVQIAMGASALVSVPVLASSFSWVAWIMGALAPSEQGYLLYSLATAVIAILVMVPAAFFAGMTLPLFTTALLRKGAGERAIGQIYAANTLGAIVGVLAAVHLLMPMLGVSLSIVVAATADVLIGIALLRGVSPRRWTPPVLLAALAAALLLAAVVRIGLPDRAHQASGVFRHGQLNSSAKELLYYKDGATASISVAQTGRQLSVATNGKPDAGLTRMGDEPTTDEVTMLMLGSLPLALHPNPERIALVGWGSGLSTHTVLGSSVPKQVDTIEIEHAMWEGAKLFNERNWRAYEDPRSKVHFEDARRFLGAGVEPYDVLISEPSNPWVSGVASLFTKEFYAIAKRHLKDDGLLIQWIHLYEMSDALLAEMVGALLVEFPNSEVYLTNFADVIVVGAKGKLGEVSAEPWRHAQLANELRRVGLNGVDDLKVRRIGGPASLKTFVQRYGAEPHSDFHPTVALAAPAKRFERQRAALLPQLVAQGMPVLNVLECRHPLPAAAKVTPDPFGQMARLHVDAIEAANTLLGKQSTAELYRRNSELAETVTMLLAFRRGLLPLDPVALREQLGVLAGSTLGLLDADVQKGLWNVADWQRAAPGLTSNHLAQIELYSAIASADWGKAAAKARLLLSPEGGNASARLREQYLVLGMLAAMGNGEQDAVSNWEHDFGKQLPRGPMGGLRDYIKAWDKVEPTCTAAGR
ncbi:MAG: spermine synthase [Methylibium sp.]|nr:spermine synthase [Methylibium sp.]